MLSLRQLLYADPGPCWRETSLSLSLTGQFQYARERESFLDQANEYRVQVDFMLPNFNAGRETPCVTMRNIVALVLLS